VDAPLFELARDEQPRIGAVVAARYRIDHLLGTGSMGAVYRADDLALGRPVAIKILHSHLGASAEAIARFHREALIGGRLAHPNCVGVTDVGTCDDGATFLAMELLDGEALVDVLGREHRIPWRRALHIARHVLHGLGHAHAQGIVHRDVKPDNIFLTPRDGDPDFARVVDFGVAKMADNSPAITQIGLTVGTPAYVSPEQAFGNQLDGRSDLYALSVVLFQAITGRAPFVDVDLIRILTAHASAAVPRLDEVAPGLDVPAEVEALIRDGLAKRPEDRIASAADYLARIDQLVAPDGADAGVGLLLDGRYRVELVLGRGGMGCVYRAAHVALGRSVAIKMLDPDLVRDDDARRRFEREALATGRLRHPNIVGVTDFGAAPDGTPYLAMELVEGATLGDVLDAQDRLPPERAVHVMRHLLRGLAHAHAQGVVHRDLKPANIMLVTEGGDRDFAKILDFGLARLVGQDDRITRTGIVCGTPRYMAPEQILNRALDPRADLYSASLILFEMLTGRTPFDADEAGAMLKMHLSAPVPRIADVAPDVAVAPALEALIHRGLAKSAADRPATAEQYLAELDRAFIPPDATIELSGSLASVIVAAAKPPPVPAAGRRHPRRALAICAAVGLLAVGGIAALAGGGRATGAAPIASAVPAGDVELELEPALVARLEPEVAQALRLASAGRGDEAALRLRELRRRRPDDPQIPYALGRIYARLGWPRQTIDAYRDAMRLDPALRQDQQLIRDLVGLLGSRSSWQLAARVLSDEVGAPAGDALAATASGHRDPTVRARAARLQGRLRD